MVYYSLHWVWFEYIVCPTFHLLGTFCQSFSTITGLSEFATKIFGRIMKTEEWDDLFMNVQKEVFELYKTKRADYSNLQGDPRGSFVRSTRIGIEPHIAALVRLGDKFTLLENFVRNNSYKSHDESVRETVLDIASYAIITAMLINSRSKDESI